MDDTDGDEARTSPFDDALEPAISPLDQAVDAGETDQTSHARTLPVDVAPIDDLVGPRKSLEPSVQGVWVLQSGVSAAILGVLAGVAFTFLPIGTPWLGGVVFVVLFLLGVVFSILRYRSWQYEVRAESLYLEHGVFTKVTTIVPHVRIQHVDARRGPLERVFGLATTVVYTAGSRGADVSIPGLTPTRADDLQSRLEQLAIAAEGEDAV